MGQLALLDDPSPLMLLNIIQKVYEDKKEKVRQKVRYKDVKEYFIKKTKDILKDINSDKQTVDENKDN